MDAKEISGICAIMFTIGMKIPQLHHTFTTKKSKDLSMSFLVAEVLGHISWLTYGIFDNNMPLIITDSICLVLSFILIGLKLYYDNRDNIEN